MPQIALCRDIRYSDLQFPHAKNPYVLGNSAQVSPVITHRIRSVQAPAAHPHLLWGIPPGFISDPASCGGANVDFPRGDSFLRANGEVPDLRTIRTYGFPTEVPENTSF
jgi:hypothetical protein